MNKMFLIVLSLFLIGGCSKKVNIKEISNRNGLGYLDQKTKPFTGKAVKFDNDRQIP